MRRIISCLLMIMILINFILCNNAYADVDPVDEKPDSTMLQNSTISEESLDNLSNGGEVEAGGAGGKQQMTLGAVGVSAIGTVAGILARIVNVLIALQIDLAMGFLSHGTETNTVDGTLSYPFWLSIDRIVYNRISLFNINYFNLEDEYQVGDVTVKANSGNIAIKKSVINVYYVCRMVAAVLALIVLIYIGIRMALSTVASEQAKYKKMIISWFESIIILFTMIYIIILIIVLGEKLTNIFYDLRTQLISEDYELFEDVVRGQAWSALFTKSGFDLAIWSIIYWCLIFMEIKFFFLYAKRFLMVGLLITVSPLIIITYSIDKAGDGQAQAFNSWMKEFIICVLIQPLHALIYLVMVFTANAIASKSPIVALALLLSMSTVEKMVRVIFDVKGSEIVKEMHFLKKGGQ